MKLFWNNQLEANKTFCGLPVIDSTLCGPDQIALIELITNNSLKHHYIL